MTSADWAVFWSISWRLTLAMVLAAAIGLEREISGRPAGLRTHMLIMLGVLCFCETGKALGGDPGRVASQVVTGIGFLGAGTILRLGPEVKGLTTAASIWATAAIGMAISAGGPYLLVGTFATVVTVFVLFFLNRIEVRFFPNVHGRTLIVEVEGEAQVGQVINALASRQIVIRELERTASDNGVAMQFRLSGDIADLPKQLAEIEGVRSASWL
ncbi:MAG: hypothetical protein HONBIEJF_02824 [Fimbriimonadaceae bacterium]|nr:hypothetical protein [Fimbriimonadaceae bacterium]